MSDQAAQRFSPGTFASRALVLALTMGTMWFASRFSPDTSQDQLDLAALASLGFLLLVGDLCGQLLEPLRFPHLTGYLGAGIVAGPHVLRLVSEHTVVQMQAVNGLALALIAFSAGAELSTEMLSHGLRSLVYSTVGQTVVLLVVLSVTFALAQPLMPFLAGKPASVVLAAALLWGTISVVKSPAAVLGVLSEIKAKGPLTTSAIALVVVLDVVIIVLFQIVSLVIRSLLDPAATVSLVQLAGVGRELLQSTALGTTLGLATGLYLAWVDRGVILFLVALAFAAGQLDRYFGYDSMLVFATAGFVVRNLTRQGEKLLAAIHRSGSVVYVIFFANAGAHLDLPTLAALWPAALLFAGVRAAVTFGVSRVAGKLAHDPPAVQRWGFAPLISQAGVALGIAVAAERSFPSFGSGFRSLAVAVIGLNEAVGPILFRFALARTGEIVDQAPGEVAEGHAPE